MGTRDAQLDLLAKVLAANETDAGTEDLPDADGLPAQRSSQVVARRTQGSIGALTGAHGRTYMVRASSSGGLCLACLRGADLMAGGEAVSGCLLACV